MSEIQFGSDYSWIVLDSDQMHQNPQIYQDYQLDEEIIAYALDENERAHMDYNPETRDLLVIYNVLNLTMDDNHYETVPITFVAQEKRLLTITNQKNNYVVNLMAQLLEKRSELTVLTFLFAALTQISMQYFPVIEEMDANKDRLNRLLRQTTTKKNLLALSDLETGIVYLVTAANQNVLLLEHIKYHHIYHRFNELEKEQFEDAMTEARQLVAMTQLISQILSQLSGTYNNVLNNNLNDNLTLLTIISILLAVIAVITGFFGMNVPLPFTKDKSAWLYIILISLVLWVIIAQFLKWIVRKR